jgi:broad specificity phosphatase PhoE
MSSSTATRLTLLRHAPTAATRRAAFDDDEAVEPSARQVIRDLAPRLGRWDAAWTGPARCAIETAAELGVTATVASALGDVGAGAWRGRSLPEIERFQPDALNAWLADPAVPPPGGESLTDVIARIAGWLDEQSPRGGRVLAVTHAVVIRAAVAHVLQAPPSAVWRIDVAPLSRTVLHARADRWTVRCVNAGAAEARSD